MSVPLSEFVPLIPEIFVLTMACVILLVDLYIKQENGSLNYMLTLGTLVVAAILSYQLTPTSGSEIVLASTFISDGMSAVLKLFLYLVTAGVVVYSRQYLSERDLFKGEFF
ncbi:MAG: NADH:ubiquinone oxidoreductase subunit N, partial [Gammaproteobacteria bacterium]|nr:NADH:ubiquinone oxidoreductase subunit N [Gammaproteobacteria bacterium]